MPAKKRKLTKMLKRLGPRVEQTDHEWYYIEEGDCRVGWAKVSFGSAGMEIDDEILSCIAKSLGLRNPQLKEYLTTKKGRDEYIEKVCSGRDLRSGAAT